IRGRNVTGVQTCALPIYRVRGTVDIWYRCRIEYGTDTTRQRQFVQVPEQSEPGHVGRRVETGAQRLLCRRGVECGHHLDRGFEEIGRASCRERLTPLW